MKNVYPVAEKHGAVQETYDYVVMLFKGFSMLTNLGYETAVPELLSEMVASLIAQNVRTPSSCISDGTSTQ